MNPHINTIANRLSLRPPQRDSLEILARLCDIVPLEKNTTSCPSADTIGVPSFACPNVICCGCPPSAPTDQRCRPWSVADV